MNVSKECYLTLLVATGLTLHSSLWSRKRLYFFLFFPAHMPTWIFKQTLMFKLKIDKFFFFFLRKLVTIK